MIQTVILVPQYCTWVSKPFMKDVHVSVKSTLKSNSHSCEHLKYVWNVNSLIIIS